MGIAAIKHTAAKRAMRGSSQPRTERTTDDDSLGACSIGAILTEYRRRRKWELRYRAVA